MEVAPDTAPATAVNAAFGSATSHEYTSDGAGSMYPVPASSDPIARAGPRATAAATETIPTVSGNVVQNDFAT